MSHAIDMLRRAIAALVLLAWLPQLGSFWNGPWEVSSEKVRKDFNEAVEITKNFPDSDANRANRELFQRVVDNPDSLVRWVWVSWAEALALIVAGLAAGIMAWRGVRLWRWLVAGTSIAYFWLFSWPTTIDLLSYQASSLNDVLRKLAMFAKYPVFFHTNFIVPILLLAVLVLLLVEAAKARRAKAPSNLRLHTDAQPVGSRPPAERR